MARRSALNNILPLLDRLEPQVRDAFVAAIFSAREGLDVRALQSALEAGDLARAVDLLAMPQGLLFPLDNSLTNAFATGGALVTESARKAGVVFGFDGRHPQAEAWARQHIGGLITGIADESREAVTVAVRDVLERQLVQGIGPRNAALDLVGRVDKATGRRVGGIVGLDGPRAERLRIVGDAMRTPEGVRSLVQGGEVRYKVNRATEARILRAYNAGTGVSERDRVLSLKQYGNQLLQQRGETISRTETITALRQGRREGFKQAVEQGKVDAQAVTRTWDATLDKRTRPDHAAMDGEKIDGLDDAWVLPDGSRMMTPGDSSLGASAGQIINCFAPWTPISRVGLRSAMRHDYTGDMIELSLGGMVNLSVTPNHPILTRRGWVAAGEVKEGDYLFHSSFGNDGAVGSSFDIEAMDARADQLYNAAKALGSVMRARRCVVDFHGHVPDEDVDIVAIPRGLGDAIKARRLQSFHKRLFAFPDVAQGRLVAFRMQLASMGIFAATSNRFMSRGRALLSGAWRSVKVAASVAFGNVWPLKPQIIKALVDGSAANADSVGDTQNRVSLTKHIRNLFKVLSTPVAVHGNDGIASSASAFSGGRNSQVLEAGCGNGLANSDNSGNFGNASAGFSSGSDVIVVNGSSGFPVIKALPVLGVRVFHYSGPVYNFESETNILQANGIINHNCRCYENIRVDWLR